jgi:hypothetical protein
MLQFLMDYGGTKNYDWSRVEKKAVRRMNTEQICLYELYTRFTRDVAIIVPLFNTTLELSYTHQQIDRALVPVRALVLTRYIFEESEVVTMEGIARNAGLPFDVREIYYWRYMVDSQIDETNLARLLRPEDAAPLSEYVSDCSDSSDDGKSCCSSVSSVDGEDSDGNSDSNDHGREASLEKIVRTTPMTGRFQRRRPHFYGHLKPRDRL